MKKIIIILTMLTTILTYSQDSTNVIKGTPYFASGLSMTNTTDFKSTSYPSMELGLMFENISVAGVFGRNNLVNNPININNYWVEGKLAYAFPLGLVDGYGVFGIGTYFGTSGSLFIEYGGGISKPINNKFSLFVQISNWDRITYFTPGFSLTF